MKKLFALMIALVMVMVVVSASAATIKISQNADPDEGVAGNETYKAYKIFDVTTTEAFTQTDENLGEGEKTGFSYTMPADSPWKSAVEGTGAFTLTLSADGTKYNVTLNEGYNTEAKAKEIAASLMDNIPSGVTPITFTTEDEAVTVDDGYYIITSSLGTNLIAATATVDLTTKNSYITDKKEVSKTDWNVGDNVEYTITVNIPASVDYAKPIVVHDTLDEVLKFNNDVEATIGDNAFDGVTTSTATEDGCTFEVTLDISSLAPTAGAEPEAKTVVLKYTAELTSAAAADTEYANTEFSTYSAYQTIPHDAKIKTYDFDLTKTFDPESEEALEATFKLYPAVDGEKGSDAIQLISGGTIDGKDITYVKADTDDTGTADIISAKNGKITNVRGLASGTYYLTEQSTAEGYNLLTTDVVITIAEDGSVTAESAEVKDGVITVENKAGTVLPSTGGMGTTIFYVIGGLLIIGAGIVLVARRKAHE